MDSYAAALAEYIQSEDLSRRLYTHLASRCPKRFASLLRSMAADEARHLRSMQLEHYLLTGDSLPPEKLPDFDRPAAELLRMAYSGEWDASEAYASQAQAQQDARLRALFLAQSRDELRHRANVKMILAAMTGMGE